MMTDTDYTLIMLKLEKFQSQLEALEREVKVLSSYVDIQVQHKYHSKPEGYVLSSGSLQDAGTAQVWYQGLGVDFKTATTKEDVEE